MDALRIYESYSSHRFITPSTLSTTSKELGVDFAADELGGLDVMADGIIISNKDDTVTVTFDVNDGGSYPLAPGESFHLPVAVRRVVIVASAESTTPPFLCLLSR